jgi:hypothetical protein
MDILHLVNPSLYDACVQMFSIMHPQIQKDIETLEYFIVQVFTRLDNNSNGTVSRGEIRSFLFDFYTNNKADRNVWAKNTIHNYDLDGNDTIDFGEFRLMVMSTLNPENMLDTIEYMKTIVEAPCVHEGAPHMSSPDGQQYRTRPDKETTQPINARRHNCPHCDIKSKPGREIVRKYRDVHP